jgi:hypothetical protein
MVDGAWLMEASFLAMRMTDWFIFCFCCAPGLKNEKLKMKWVPDFQTACLNPG